MTYTNISQIKAHVKTNWSHGNHKFNPGDHVEVSVQVLPREWVGSDGEIRSGQSYVSQVKQRRVGRVGKVVAVTCTKSGRVRGCYMQDGNPSRMYTRYYIQFSDGTIYGYDSHFLKKAFTWS
jgi:hypothetical protein